MQHPTQDPPLEQRAPGVISLGLVPTWVFGPVMADFRVHSWVGVHLPEAYVEKKSLLLDSWVAQRAFTALRLLVCFVKVLSSVHAVCWNQLFLFSCMAAEPPLSCCCRGHGSPVRGLEVHPLLQGTYSSCS